MIYLSATQTFPGQWDWTSLFFVALVRVPGDGCARAFLNGGAGDAACKLVRIAAGKLDLAALHFANLTQDKGFRFQVLLFSNRAFFQFDLKVK
jgi:hypothetical protein